MNKSIKPAAAALAFLLCGLLIAACGTTGSAGGVAGMLSRIQPLAANCDGPLNVYVADDTTSSGLGDSALTERRLQAEQDLADQVVACGGYLKVVAFTSNAAETFTLGEGEFPTSASTDNARLIQGSKVAEELMGEVEDNLPKALQSLNPNGSDILAQLGLAQQFQAQRAEGSLYVAVLSDGIATVKPVVMNTPAFTVQAAQEAAEAVSVPNLDGATVRVVGIGQTTGVKRPSTQRIEALTTFYEQVCQRTGADCLVTTDYTRGG